MPSDKNKSSKSAGAGSKPGQNKGSSGQQQQGESGKKQGGGDKQQR